MRPDPPPPRGVLRTVAILLASGLGAGFSPFAPGTAGTLFPAVPLGAWLASRGLWPTLIGAGVLLAVGTWAAGICERAFRRKDPPPVVIDEVVGFLITIAGLEPRWQVLLAGFLVFRVLDVLKPWPAGLIDRTLPGGAGVMLDDVAAGLYSRAVLALIFRS